MCTSRNVGGSILRGGRQNFRNEPQSGGRTSIMFAQTRGKGNQGERISTSGNKSPQGYPVTGKYVQLYRHTECYVCYSYVNFSDQCLDKKPK